MSEENKNLADEIKSLKIFSLNGSNFIGKITNKTEEKQIEVTDAIAVQTTDFKKVIKTWIKSKNLNKLEVFTVDGSNNTLVTKGFTEENLMIIDIISAEAVYAMRYAVANLRNAAIGD